MKHLKFLRDMRSASDIDAQELHDVIGILIDNFAKSFEKEITGELIYEKGAIMKALKQHDGKQKDAAHSLGISERTLCLRMQEYGLNKEITNY